VSEQRTCAEGREEPPYCGANALDESSGTSGTSGAMDKIATFHVGLLQGCFPGPGYLSMDARKRALGYQRHG